MAFEETNDRLAETLPSEASPTPRITFIEPSRGWVSLNLRELWEYRTLIYFLILRNLKVRYKQTILGVSWVILQPFLSMVVFTVFFGNLAKIPSDGVPYPIFSYAGLLPWLFFANGLNRASGSMVTGIINKVYFPRLAMPVSAVVSGGVDFVLACSILVGMMFFYGIYPGWAILWLPFLALLAAIVALGAGLWLSAINVHYRDVRQVLPFLIQMWMFASPVVYPTSILPERWHLLYGINPMAGVIEGFRWALLGTSEAPIAIISIASVVAITLLITGAFFFKRMERTFADVV